MAEKIRFAGHLIGFLTEDTLPVKELFFRNSIRSAPETKKSSTIFCSRYLQEGWYEQLGGEASPLADAILDRIVYDANKINIQSIDPSQDISMRAERSIRTFCIGKKNWVLINSIKGAQASAVIYSISETAK